MLTTLKIIKKYCIELNNSDNDKIFIIEEEKNIVQAFKKYMRMQNKKRSIMINRKSDFNFQLISFCWNVAVFKHPV